MKKFNGIKKGNLVEFLLKEGYQAVGYLWRNEPKEQRLCLTEHSPPLKFPNNKVASKFYVYYDNIKGWKKY